MTILEGEKAVSYLRTARSTLDDGVYPSNLAATLVNLELTLLESLLNSADNPVGDTAKKLAKITLDSTGFPDLVNWMVDTAEVFRLYSTLKSTRAKATVGLLQMVMNASPDSLSQSATGAAAMLTANNEIAVALSHLNEKKLEFLHRLPTSPASSSPITTNAAHPGLLLFNSLPNAFNLDPASSRSNNIFGLKYFPPSGKKRARTLFAELNNGLPSFRYQPRPAYPEAQLKLEDLNPNLLQIFLSLDTPSLPPKGLSTVYSALSRAQELVVEVTKFYETQILSAAPITATTLDLQVDHWKHALSAIYTDLPTEAIKSQFQIAIATVLKPLSDKVTQTAHATPSSLSVTESVRRDDLPGELSELLDYLDGLEARKQRPTPRKLVLFPKP